MGAKIAGYELLEALGRSRWGTTYRARQVSLDRTVLLTILPPQEKAPAVHSLARICAGLTHPHLISGIDFGEHRGRRFLVMEWVEGPSIADVVLRGGAIAEERALEIAFAVAQGLEVAGSHGLVHGNITPEAIIIAQGGNPKLRGFTAVPGLKRSKLDWRSPERKLDRSAGVRSDIWSLGAILHLMLGGRYPFDDAPPAEVVDGVVVEESLPLQQVTRKLQPETYDLVERMMARSPDARFDTAHDLVETLDNLLGKLDDRVSLRPGRTARPARAITRRARPGRSRRRRRR